MLVAGGDPPCEAEALVVVVVPRWATAVPLGLLPHAANSRAPLATNTVVRGTRRLSRAGPVGDLSMRLVISGALLQE